MRDVGKVMRRRYTGLPSHHFSLVSGQLSLYAELFRLRATGDCAPWCLARREIDLKTFAEMSPLGTGRI